MNTSNFPPGTKVQVLDDHGTWRNGQVVERERTDRIDRTFEYLWRVKLNSGPRHMRDWCSSDRKLIRALNDSPRLRTAIFEVQPDNDEVKVPLTRYNEVTREWEEVGYVIGKRDFAEPLAKELVRRWNNFAELEDQGIENVTIHTDRSSTTLQADASLNNDDLKP